MSSKQALFCHSFRTNSFGPPQILLRQSVKINFRTSLRTLSFTTGTIRPAVGIIVLPGWRQMNKRYIASKGHKNRRQCRCCLNTTNISHALLDLHHLLAETVDFTSRKVIELKLIFHSVLIPVRLPRTLKFHVCSNRISAYTTGNLVQAIVSQIIEYFWR